MAKVAERLFDLFSGFERSHGRYQVPADAKPDPKKGKLEGERWTSRGPATVELWERHLVGEQSFGLGVAPIREDATCWWAAIDVDVYPIDHAAIVARCAAMGLPLVVCRTKSGGAHLFLFMRAPAPAELVRSRMVEFAAALGYAGVEVFPKQTRIPTDEDHGNWVNMPYQAGRRTTRYAYGPGAVALSLEEFLDAAEAARVDEDWLRAFEPTPPELEGLDEDALEGAPPCLQTIAARGGFAEFRNNAMFNVCVYLRKRYGEGWGERAEDYNRALMTQPLEAAEVATIVKSIGKKSYSYKCKDEPICGVCNKEVCATREHGVGGGNRDPGVHFGDMLKMSTDPVTWVWEIAGAKIELTTEELYNQNLLARHVTDKTNKVPKPMKGPAWLDLVRLALENVVESVVPPDATREGQLREHLVAFCTGRARAQKLDEILMGKAFADGVRGRTYFRATDFIAYLQQHRVLGFSERSIYVWLRREMELDTHAGKLKGKDVSYWSVPSFSEQTEEHDVPRAKLEEM